MINSYTVGKFQQRLGNIFIANSLFDHFKKWYCISNRSTSGNEPSPWYWRLLKWPWQFNDSGCIWRYCIQNFCRLLCFTSHSISCCLFYYQLRNLDFDLCYQQNIFLGEDIRKQLPRESAEFDDVNANWKVYGRTFAFVSSFPGLSVCLCPQPIFCLVYCRWLCKGSTRITMHCEELIIQVSIPLYFTSYFLLFSFSRMKNVRWSMSDWPPGCCTVWTVI